MGVSLFIRNLFHHNWVYVNEVSSRKHLRMWADCQGSESWNFQLHPLISRQGNDLINKASIKPQTNWDQRASELVNMWIWGQWHTESCGTEPLYNLMLYLSR